MLEANVVGVIAYYSAHNPFIWTEDKTAPRGVIIEALYLEGRDGKGVFGDGVIRPKMYVSEMKPDGTRDWVLTKEWKYEVEEAIPFRSKRPTVGGWGYRLHLVWGDMDIKGREIRIIVSFERRDGIVITSRKKDFRVPQRGQ